MIEKKMLMKRFELKSSSVSSVNSNVSDVNKSVSEDVDIKYKYFKKQLQ